MATRSADDVFSQHADAVEVMLDCGVPFRDVEVAVQDADLCEDSKSALWLLAWSRETATDQLPRPVCPPSA